MPEDLCDFFDLCWSNPRDRRVMLSRDKFDYDKIGDSKEKLIIKVLHPNPANTLMKKD